MFVSPDPPSAPRWLDVVSISRNSAELKWTVPERDGGSAITNYVVEKRDVRRKGWQAVDTTVKELKYTVTPLNEGSLYVFRVAAENAVGVGPFCELTDSVLAKDTFSESKMSLCSGRVDRGVREGALKCLPSFSHSWTTLCSRCQCCDQTICGPAVGGT